MGMYTELIVGCRLKKETPHEVISTLQWMMSENDNLPVPENLPAKGSRTKWMLRSAGSYYFGSPCPVPAILKFDKNYVEYQFHCRFNIKNYEGEIEAFLEWLKPWVSQGSGARELWAIKIYEEDEEPTCYYLVDRNGTVNN